jgi:hypothetical protein
LYVLDSDGSFLASTTIQSVEEVTEMLDDPEGLSASEVEAAGNAETVSIRVSGFMAAEGIT